jgi:hypothetical protein
MNYLDKKTNDFIFKILNTKMGKIISKSKYFKDKRIKSGVFSEKNYKYLEENDYNKSINIDELNQYTILRIDNVSSTLDIKNMAKECLKNILDTKKILINNKHVNFKDCVILDLANISSSAIIHGFHTDGEYHTYTGNAFNVWYLIENNKKYGNLFLLESDDYKKEYTPCALRAASDDKFAIELTKGVGDQLISSLISSFIPSLSGNNKIYINKNNTNITYANIKNHECVVMTKHMLHAGDYRRTDDVKGFHFRVIVKNKDGSINYDSSYKPTNKYPNHIWKNNKLYGVELFDFI